MVLSLSTFDTFTLDSLSLDDDFFDDLESYAEAETGPLESSPELDACLADEECESPSPLPQTGRDQLFTSEQQYRADIARYTPLGRLSAEQRQTLAERARQDDQQARTEMIHCLLYAVERFAARYFFTHSWRSSRIEYTELIAVGNETLYLFLDRALATNHPYAYLLTVAYHAMRHQGMGCRSLIAVPSGSRRAIAPPTESLDVPLSENSPRTLADLLPEPRPLSPKAESEEAALHHSIEQLPPSFREAIHRLFGFGGMGVERLYELCHDLDGRKTRTFEAVQMRKVRALALLYLALKDAYPQYVAAESEPVAVPYHVTLVRRVEQTYTALQASGEPITVARLNKAGNVDRGIAGAFLHQVGADSASERARRLERAYDHLRATGQPIMTETLMKEAHVDQPIAKRFLRQHGIDRSRSELDNMRVGERSQRLDQAYSRLQATGQLISQRALIKEAHTEFKYARPYLYQRLDQAYAQLQGRNATISSQQLSDLTQIDRFAVKAYLLHRAAHEMEKRPA